MKRIRNEKGRKKQQIQKRKQRDPKEYREGHSGKKKKYTDQEDCRTNNNRI